VLIDSRHGFKDADNEVLTTLDKAAVSYQIVLTKADQVKKSALEQTMAAMAEKLRKHPAAFPEMLVTSSRDGGGMAEMRAAIVKLLRERA
jgi:GTP-binding protein